MIQCFITDLTFSPIDDTLYFMSCQNMDEFHEASLTPGRSDCEKFVWVTYKTFLKSTQIKYFHHISSHLDMFITRQPSFSPHVAGTWPVSYWSLPPVIRMLQQLPLSINLFKLVVNFCYVCLFCVFIDIIIQYFFDTGYSFFINIDLILYNFSYHAFKVKATY